MEGQGGPKELEGLGDRVGMAMLVHLDLQDLLFVWGGGLLNLWHMFNY